MPGRLAIDFGTSNTVVALWDEAQQTGIPFHIPDYGSFYQHDNEVRQLSRALLVECERAKVRLSNHERADVTVMNPNTGAVLSAEFTRSKFEDLLDDNEAFNLIDTTIRCALNSARERGYQGIQTSVAIKIPTKGFSTLCLPCS